MDTLYSYVDSVIPPKAREEYTKNTLDFAKGSPLAFSFLSTQASFSAIPLAVFAFFSISVLVLTIGTALFISALLIGSAALLLLPILFVTCSTATVVWASTVAFYTTCNWLYSQIYQGSSVEQELLHVRDSASSLKKEIDYNGSQEYGSYVNGVKSTGQDVANQAQQSYNGLRDTAAGATDDVQRTINGTKNSLFKNDGIVDGMKAKSNRVGDTVKSSPVAKDVY